MDSIKDSTSVLERATLATSGSTSTNPSGVEQPGVGLVCLDLFSKHASVAHGVKSKERLSEARGEGSLGLGNTVLSTSHLGGVTGDEVEHGLLSGKLGDRGKDTTSVASQEDDVLRVAITDAGQLGVANVVNRVGAGTCMLANVQ